MPSPEERRPEPDYRTVLTAYERARTQCEQRPTDANLARLWVTQQRLYEAILKPGSLSIIEKAGQVPLEFRAPPQARGLG